MEKICYTIGEVARELGENTSTVRFWSDSFPKFVHPTRNAKGNRIYKAEDIETFRLIQFLLKTERLTIDFNLSFHNYETLADTAMDNIVIIELKRDGRQPSPILSILRTLRIKPSGFSKYCIGSAMTNDLLPQNRFKPRLRKMERIAAGRH